MLHHTSSSFGIVLNTLLQDVVIRYANTIMVMGLGGVVMTIKEIAITDIKNLIETINSRICATNKKIVSHYGHEYYNGVIFAYVETLSDLYGILNKLED